MNALLLLALAAGPPVPRLDALGVRLPDGAVARLGSTRHLQHGLSGPVMSLDARFLAAPAVGGIRVSDADTCRPVELIAPPPRVGVAGCVALSPDGSRVANFGDRFSYGLSSDVVVVYPLLKGGMPAFVPSYSADMPVSFSRDGGRLASVETRAKAAVWDLGRKKRIRVVEMPDGALSAAALSPNGQTLATCNDTGRFADHRVRVWDVATGKMLAEMKADGPHLTHAVFSPTGRSLATLQLNGRFVLWDLPAKKALAHVTRPVSKVVAFAFAPDGRQVAVAGDDGAVEFYDARSAKRLAVGKGPAGARLTGLGFRPDSQPVAVGVCASRVALWDAATGKVLSPQAGHTTPVHALAFRPNGDLVSGAADGCRVWRAGSWKESSRAERPLPEPSGIEGQRTTLSPDGQHAVWSGASPALLVDATTGRRRGRLDGPLDAPSPHSLYAFSPDGRQLAQLLPAAPRTGKGRLRLWTLPGLRGGLDQEVDADSVGPDRREQAIFSPDGAALAITGCAPSYVTARGFRRRGVLSRGSQGAIFGLPDGKKRADFLMPLKGCLAWSPDGRLLAATNLDGGVSILNAADGKRLGAVSPTPKAAGKLMAFSPCGRLLAVAFPGGASGQGQVTVYETATGTPRMALRGHEGEVLALAFSRDARRLATGGADTTVLLWDLSGREWARLDDETGLWDDLADEEAGRAFRAMARLARRPSETVPFLRRHLKPAPGKGLDEAGVKRHIEGLGSDDFDTRQRSQQALTEAITRLAPRLEKALRDADDLEVRERLKVILKSAAAWPRPGGARPARAVEVLERLGTPAARKFLGELAAGNTDFRLTMEARAALKRLEKRR